MANLSLEEAISLSRGGEVAFICPKHDDNNSSASLNFEKGVWHCFVCHASGKLDKKKYEVDKDITLMQIGQLMTGEIPPRYYTESWLDLFDSQGPSPYWVSRFGKEIASKHRCGTHFRTGFPTYPIRDSAGRLLGVVVRQDGQPKYKYPAGIRTSATFYGNIKPSKVIVLVEGAADVMALDESGIPKHWTVLGCYGSGLHHPQVEILKELSPKLVVTAFDNDKAGIYAGERALYQLKDLAAVLTHNWATLGVNDPGDAKVSDRIASIKKTIQDSPYKTLIKESA
jgi:hypothetical protein